MIPFCRRDALSLWRLVGGATATAPVGSSPDDNRSAMDRYRSRRQFTGRQPVRHGPYRELGVQHGNT